MRKIVLLGLVFLASISLAADKSPYAGEELRSIKSLSPQEVESLRSGHGMGFAKLAELNHYPGPKHVLELASDLELTPTQLAQTDEIFRRMQDRAVALGEQLLEHFHVRTVEAVVCQVNRHLQILFQADQLS